MDFKSFYAAASTEFWPGVVLENILPRRVRRIGKHALFIILIFLYVRSIFIGDDRSFGFVLIATAIVLFFLAIDAFINSFYFKSLGGNDKPDLSFELSQVLSKTETKDIVPPLFKSSFGKALLSRCGITSDDFKDFLRRRKNQVAAEYFYSETADFTFSNYCKGLFSKDEGLVAFFLKFGIREKDFFDVVSWLENAFAQNKKEERRWSKENLLKISGVGKSWAFGEIYELKKFSYDAGNRGRDWEYLTQSRKNLITLLETTLSRSEEANALIIGEDGTGRMEIVSGLARKTKEGRSSKELNYHQFLVLDHNYLVASGGGKVGFEKGLLKILNQSAAAGDVVLVLEDFPSFLGSARSLGSDLADILDPYLASTDLKVIAVSDKESFHRLIEPNSHLSSKFEIVEVEEDDLAGLREFLLSSIIPIENKEKVYFTYQALRRAAESAQQYFAGKETRDKALDILTEAAYLGRNSSRRLITEGSIESLIEKKTGIAVGEVKGKERFKLEHLEEILHQRVVGQDEAIKGVSLAIRRARSGVASPKKPLGSFLFLGPTGVGKTETAKTLAEVFFGSEDKMIRLDMSEYNSPDAVEKLLGSFETGQVGVLSSQARDNPYTVLLLDEFEKTHPEVLNLFLQILDEGVFSDMYGKKISVRSMVIIATSNAGSDDIWEIIKRGENLPEKKDEIIESIIEKGIFKPELLNRFDGVILFHPLGQEHLQTIARKILSGLSERLKEKGVELSIDNSLIDYLVKKGSDPKFGARPLERVIKEEIEEAVAKKIIHGYEKGEKITISLGDLSP